MTGARIDLPQGTLDLLILRTLALGPQHGWAISERVQQMSSDVLQIQQGSLYPALHRMERRGLIKARWGTSENNRRAKYYELSKNGRQQLEVLRRDHNRGRDPDCDFRRDPDRRHRQEGSSRAMSSSEQRILWPR